MNSNKRKTLLAMMGVGTVICLPNEWLKPAVNCIVLPAHAATSTGQCSAFTTEPVTGSITVEVSDTQAIGPVAAERIGDSFSVTVNEVVNPIGLNVDSVDQRTVFSGTIDTVLNEVRGELRVLQTCDGQLVCEQITTYTSSLSGAVMANGVGQYVGQLSGTLRCCQDFL